MCLLFVRVTLGIVGGSWLGGFYHNEIHYVLVRVLQAVGEWMFSVGLYSTLNFSCNGNYTIIKLLRELAMPYYLIHIPIIVYLKAANVFKQGFMTSVILLTFATGICSFLIVKSPACVRYFFGLPSQEKAFLGKWLKGCGPFVFLIVIRFMEYLIANDVTTIVSLYVKLILSIFSAIYFMLNI